MRRTKAAAAALWILLLCLLSACSVNRETLDAARQIDGLTLTERVETSYAEQFAIDRYEGGYSLIRVANGQAYLIVPPGGEVPSGLSGNIAVIRQPVKDAYLAASAAMGLFDALDGMDALRFSGIRAEDWTIENARLAMERGDLIYAGKYRDPDYELICAADCPLAIESTMIEHAPQVREKLQELGIVVFEDFAGYETHPLGRSEWIKVYGELLGKPERAAELFEEQKRYIDALNGQAADKTVAFFYINAAGQAVTRRSGDYVSKMIDLAGGSNVFYDRDADADTHSSTMTVEMEAFYEQAKDADVVIYNTIIEGDVTTVAELVGKNPLLAEFRAVQNGNVWCTRHNFYQETMRLGQMIDEMHAIFSDRAASDTLQFFYRLKDE